MKISPFALLSASICLLLLGASTCLAETKAKITYPVALFPFEERGTSGKELGVKVADLLFAKLAANPEVYLVDRGDLNKVLTEFTLNNSGMVRPEDATKLGRLSGAKLLVTGSVVQADKSLYLIAKIIGTETSRVAGVSAEGKLTDDLATLVDKLAAGIGDAISKQAADLVAKTITPEDRLVQLKAKLKDGKRPMLWIRVAETHFGHRSFDPAVQTELGRFCTETGFGVLDVDDDKKGKADFIITGEGFSEVAGRVGGLVAVKARVEVKVVEWKTDKIVTVERETAVAMDLAENVAAKAALQEAAAILAERLLPKILNVADR
jgi:TolB-like protein